MFVYKLIFCVLILEQALCDNQRKNNNDNSKVVSSTDVIGPSDNNNSSDVPTTEAPVSTTEPIPPTTESNDNNNSTDAPTTEVPVSTTTPLPSTTDSIDQTCPDDLSAFSRSDIREQITKSRIIGTLSEELDEVFLFAKQIALNEEENIISFLEMAQNKPHHLKHILQDIAGWRTNLTETLEHIASELQDYPSLEAEYNMKNNKVKHLLQSLQKFKKICHLNCDEPTLLKGIYRRNENKYCSSIKQLEQDIDNYFAPKIDSLKSSLIDYIKNKNDNYSIIIENSKNKLKNDYIAYFGITMFNILHLSDEYFHYNEMLDGIQIDKSIDGLSTSFMEIDLKTMELNRKVKDYGKYCLSCSDSQKRFGFRAARTHYSAPKYMKNLQASEYSSDVLQSELEAFDEEIKKRVNYGMARIFLPLDDAINEMGSSNKTIEKIQDIKHEIDNIAESEQQELDNIIQQIDDSPKQMFFKLIDKTANLLSELNQTLIKFPLHPIKYAP